MYTYTGGLDEVGRGSLAGPILAVLAIFKGSPTAPCPIPGVRDSKAYAYPIQRIEIFYRLLALDDLVFVGIGEAEASEIDQIGVDEANRQIFSRALELAPKAQRESTLIIIDGRLPLQGFPSIQQYVVPKADKNHWQVSAASVIAKVIRDRYMRELDRIHPGYQWFKNVGYGTEDHTRALLKLGPSPQHRQSFIHKIVSAGGAP